MRGPHPFTVLVLEGVDAAGRALELQVPILVVGDGHDHIRADAHFMDHLVAGGIVFGRGQPQRGTVVQRDDALDGAFAEGFLAQDDCAMQILEAAGDNLRRAGAPGVDQDKEWPDFADRTWGNTIYKYYGYEPYWKL